MTQLKEQILRLRSTGASYRTICQQLQCSKGSVSYHCGVGQKLKTKIRCQRGRERIRGILYSKIAFFSSYNNRLQDYRSDCTIRKSIKNRIEGYSRMSGKNKTYVKPTFSIDDFIQKIGEHPKCYLSGAPIDLTDKKSWSMDHIIPRSRGGSNDLDNAGICNSMINLSKNSMLVDEFLEMCKLVLEFNGYEITEKKDAPSLIPQERGLC
jgi:5-methylcytosine-specific restriction endonuclease McrA